MIFSLKTFVEGFGSIVLFSYISFKNIFSRHLCFNRVFTEIYQIGIKSIPVCNITILFVGMVFTFQIIQEFIKFGATKLIGGVVALAIVRELSPLLIGVVACARIGASITAELGTMSVTEQIDALKVMGKNPISYLVTPKLMGSVISLPVLVGVGNIVGFLGGLIIVLLMNKINPYSYFSAADIMLTNYDIFCGLIKAGFFGFIIAIISCYHGLNCHRGAQSVGINTTKSVVYSLISIFIVNFFLSTLLF